MFDAIILKFYKKGLYKHIFIIIYALITWYEHEHKNECNFVLFLPTKNKVVVFQKLLFKKKKVMHKTWQYGEAKRRLGGAMCMVIES